MSTLPAGDLSGLPAAVVHHARATPSDPWLFYPHGLDWHWRSWAAVAAQIEASVEGFASLPRGTRVGFLYRPEPDRVVLDLALQAAGLAAVLWAVLHGAGWVRTHDVPETIDTLNMLAAIRAAHGEAS